MSGGGGGSSAPATVSPTTNTQTVQNVYQPPSSGKGGNNSLSSFQPPVQRPQSIQFGGYGQQSPFGLTNPQTWGNGLGGVQSGSSVINAFTPTTTQSTTVPTETSSPIVSTDTGGSSVFDTSTPTSGTLDTGAGTSLNYSSPGELANAENIQQVIADGGVNESTGDNNIVAGPNVLSASDDGALNFGSNYNDQFQENYAAQSAHAEANPYGQSTGTPLTEQGFVSQGGIADTLVNNGLYGNIASGLTGKELLPTTSNYLPPPPVEDTAVDGFQGIYSGGGADGVGNFGKVGDFFGGIGDSLGITNYSGENTPESGSVSTYTPPSANPNQAAADAHAAATSGSKAQEKAESAAQVVKNKTKAEFFKEFGSTGKKAEQAWINDEKKRKDAAIAAAGGEQAWLNAGAHYNKGGKVPAGK